jgi:hypothetical protein
MRTVEADRQTHSFIVAHAPKKKETQPAKANILDQKAL